ncbi:MAG: TonB-dependent receptor [Mucilaginibacter sp.]|nr:TonB-dependent receptor [Mucilaginibacter sp.]
MKLNLKATPLSCHRLSKFLLAMKLAAILIMATLVQVSAKGYTQNITLHEKNISITKILVLIEKQSGYHFLYDKLDLPKNEKVSIAVTNATIEDVLNLCIKDQPITYKIMQQTIVLKKSEKVANPVSNVILKVTGKIIDEHGDPLPGATISVKNTNIATAADINGVFTLNVPDASSILVVSFVGYLPKEVAITEGDMTIQLTPAPKSLNEVIVVGYGSQLRREVTGAESSISSSEIAKRPITQLTQALQGEAAGVAVVSANGQPGQGPRVKIRGANSITGNNEPLYVTDGNIGAGPDDPNDIESIEILKDAASTAIYGSRGSNGVVLITTKSGHSGQTRINFNTWVQHDQMPKTLDLMGAYDFARSVNNQFIATGSTAAFSQAQLDAFKTNGGTDWQNALFTKPWVQYYGVDVSGGTDATKYRVSFSHLNQPGTILNSFYKRSTLRVNLDAKLNDKMDIKFILGASIPQSHNNSYGGGLGDPFNQAVEWDPTSPIRDPVTGAYINHSAYASIQFNPVEQAASQAADGTGGNFNGNVTFNYRIIKDLTFTSTDVYSLGQNYQQNFFGPGTSNFDSKSDYISNLTTRTTSYLSSNFLTYKHRFGDHQITGTALYEISSATSTNFGATSKGLSTYALGYYNLALGSTQQNNSGYIKDALVSYLARINYSYKDKYFLTAAIRTDGSSHLTQKYSSFPSVGLAWNASNEDFLRDSKVISDFKVRLSYGQTGNQNVGAYSTIATINTGGGQSNYYYGGGSAAGAGTPSVATPLGTGVSKTLKWETKTAYDLGVDIAFLQGRLRFTLDAYKNNIKNLLYQQPAPNYDNGGSYQANIGSITNNGIEFSLGGSPVATSSFKWNTNVNLSINRNKVTDLGGLDNVITGAGNNTVNAILKVGQPLGEFYGYRFLGTWKTSEAAQAALYGMKPGDAKYEDINGDHAYTSADYQLLGNATPQFTYGWSNDIAYKNFTLSFLFQGQQGSHVFSQTLAYLWGGLGDMKNATTIEAVPENLWTPGNQTNNPAWSSSSHNYNNSSRYVYNSSFVKLRNLSLAYDVPVALLKKASIRSLQLYVSGQNLLTITPYKGYDPEIDNGGNAIVQGQEFGVIPNPKTYTLGVRLGL